MLDALCPAERALSEALAGGASLKEALGKAVDAAEAGLVHTRDIIATKGRASYLGERSLGHQDPGAASSLLMLQVIETAL
jgi:dihydroxyacetone kinase-like protein